MLVLSRDRGEMEGAAGLPCSIDVDPSFKAYSNGATLGL
jgi:hypothetical protein